MLFAWLRIAGKHLKGLCTVKFELHTASAIIRLASFSKSA